MRARATSVAGSFAALLGTSAGAGACAAIANIPELTTTDGGGSSTRDAGADTTAPREGGHSGSGTGSGSGKSKMDSGRGTGTGSGSAPPREASSEDAGLVATLLYDGGATVYGVTLGGDVIYGASGGLYAISVLTTGTPSPMTIKASLSTAASVTVKNDVVGVLEPGDSGGLSLSFWSRSSAPALVPLATQSTGLLAVSDDSTFIAYSMDVDSNGMGEVRAAPVNPSPTSVPVVPDALLTAPAGTCFPTFTFDSTWLIASVCTSVGASTQTVTAYKAPLFNPVMVASDVPGPFVATDTVGASILTISATQAPPTLLLFSLLSGPMSLPFPASANPIYLGSDSSFALFQQASPQTELVEVLLSPTQPPPFHLSGSSTSATLAAISPDERYLVYTGDNPQSTGYPIHVEARPSGSQATDTDGGLTLSSGMGKVLGFTADGSYLIYLDKCTSPVGATECIGELLAFSLGSSAAPVLLESTPTVWNATPYGTGKGLVYNFAYTTSPTTPSANGSAYADICTVNVGTGVGCAPVVSNADANYYIVMGSKLVYTVTPGNDGLASAGIFVVTLP